MSFLTTWEDLLAERGIVVSYESIRQWCNRFGPEYAQKLKKRQGQLGDTPRTWYLDEVFIKIRGELHRGHLVSGRR